jgi:hypothetical protein
VLVQEVHDGRSHTFFCCVVCSLHTVLLLVNTALRSSSHSRSVSSESIWLDQLDQLDQLDIQAFQPGRETLPRGPQLVRPWTDGRGHRQGRVSDAKMAD